jgi:uroporphyrinogen-III decarboxylase
MANRDEWQRLIGEMQAVIASDRNRRNAAYFAPQPPWGRGLFRAVPKLSPGGGKPFVVEPDISLWSTLLKIDIPSFFRDAEHYLKSQIRINLHKFNFFKDNTWFKGEFSPWPGVAFELSLFGAEVTWPQDRAPWIKPDPVLKEYRDLDRLRPPDFYRSGLMGMVHDNYKKLTDIVGDDLTVVFPEWTCGPFGIASHLRGVSNLLLDCLAEPEWVERLLNFIVDSQLEWTRERARFTGQPVSKAILYDDDVDCPTISPSIYKNLVLPCEQRIAAFHGGLTYFHSCGHLTKLLPYIREIGPIDMLHVSPWTDAAEALRQFALECAFDVCLDPVDDVLNADPARQASKLKELLKVFGDDAAFSIRADAFQRMGDWEADYAKILSWCGIARDVLGHSGP